MKALFWLAVAVVAAFAANRLEWAWHRSHCPLCKVFYDPAFTNKDVEA